MVIRVDEAGLFGARRTERLIEVVQELRKSGVQVKLHLLGDAKQMQGNQAGNLLGPRQKLEVGGKIVFARPAKGSVVTRDRARAEPGRPTLAENARRVLRTLERRQEAVEIADRVQLGSALVRHYLEESPKALAGTEADRVGRTAAGASCHHHVARSELTRDQERAGEDRRDCEGTPYRVLVPARQGMTVEGYRVGDAVHFCGVPDPGRPGRTLGDVSQYGGEGDRNKPGAEPGTSYLLFPHPQTRRARTLPHRHQGVLRSRHAGKDGALP